MKQQRYKKFRKQRNGKFGFFEDEPEIENRYIRHRRKPYIYKDNGKIEHKLGDKTDIGFVTNSNNPIIPLTIPLNI